MQVNLAREQCKTSEDRAGMGLIQVNGSIVECYIFVVKGLGDF
jgi:hypothetical protein